MHVNDNWNEIRKRLSHILNKRIMGYDRVDYVLLELINKFEQLLEENKNLKEKHK